MIQYVVHFFSRECFFHGSFAFPPPKKKRVDAIPLPKNKIVLQNFALKNDKNQI